MKISAAQPFLAKILGSGAEEIGEVGHDYVKGRRAKDAERTLADANKLLADVGREPQQVPLSIAVPLLEAASLQDDPTLADLWAALLVNAADPAQKAIAHPSFITVLQQLTTDDALVLAFVYANIPLPSQPGELRVVDFSTQLSGQQVMNHFSWTKDRIGLSFENLERLKLINMFSSPLNYDTKSGVMQNTGPYINSKTFGHLFLAAVTPPTA